MSGDTSSGCAVDSRTARLPRINAPASLNAAYPTTDRRAPAGVGGPSDLLGQAGQGFVERAFRELLMRARVVDELMGRAGGQRGGGAPAGDGSLIGTRYRWTTPEMQARVMAAIEQRLAVPFGVAAQLKDDR